MKPIVIGLVVASSLVSASGVAFADRTADARLAQALFDEARTLMDQKRYVEACPKLQESQRLDPGGGTLLNLAVCHAGEGRIATALVEYREALSVAVRDGRTDREQIARSSIEALEQDVPRLTVNVPHPVPGLEVKLDSVVLAQPAWGVSTPVDPGPHAVFVTWPGKAETTTWITLGIKEKKSVDVDAPPESSTAPPAPPAAATPPPPTWNVERLPGKPNPMFYAAAGVTALAGTVTVITGLMALSKESDAEKGCIEDRTFCRDEASRDALSSARSLAWVSTGALVVTAVGVVLLIVTPSRKQGAIVHTAASALKVTF